MAKEVRQLARDRITFGMVIGIPLLQIILFGYAINTDVRHLSGGVVDLAGNFVSRALVQDIEITQVVDFIRKFESADELSDAMRSGRVSVGLVIPSDVSDRMNDGRAIAQVLVDGSDPVVFQGIAQIRSFPVGNQAAIGEGPEPALSIRNFYNPERRSAVYIIPGLIGVILTLTMVLFTSIAIVREKERGNMELLITTPVRSFELMVGKILPYIFIGLIQAGIILLIGRYLFIVVVQGHLLDLLMAVTLFIAASLTLGLLISTAANSQFQAMQMTMFTFLPSILLSGFMFPFDGMPRAAQVIAEVFPLTHFLRLSRGIILRGATIQEMPDESMILLLFTVVVMTIAVLRFRKRLD
jgi:ABC-2 type transport system permease protein